MGYSPARCSMSASLNTTDRVSISPQAKITRPISFSSINPYNLPITPDSSPIASKAARFHFERLNREKPHIRILMENGLNIPAIVLATICDELRRRKGLSDEMHLSISIPDKIIDPHQKAEIKLEISYKMHDDNGNAKHITIANNLSSVWIYTNYLRIRELLKRVGIKSVPIRAYEQFVFDLLSPIFPLSFRKLARLINNFLIVSSNPLYLFKLNFFIARYIMLRALSYLFNPFNLILPIIGRKLASSQEYENALIGCHNYCRTYFESDIPISDLIVKANNHRLIAFGETHGISNSIHFFKQFLLHISRLTHIGIELDSGLQAYVDRYAKTKDEKDWEIFLRKTNSNPMSPTKPKDIPNPIPNDSYPFQRLGIIKFAIEQGLQVVLLDIPQLHFSTSTNPIVMQNFIRSGHRDKKYMARKINNILRNPVNKILIFTGNAHVAHSTPAFPLPNLTKWVSERPFSILALEDPAINMMAEQAGLGQETLLYQIPVDYTKTAKSPRLFDAVVCHLPASDVNWRV
ncbi:MAG: hypothetical protein WC624_01705 [Candidatus Margulisiibacteriota bacterium]